MSSTEHPALVEAARWGIAAARAPVTLTDGAFDSLRGVVTVDRLGGLLFHAVADGRVVVSPATLVAVHGLWNEQLLASVVVEAQAVRAAEVLDAAGVRWRLTKGAALAHLDYPDPSLRPFGDVDVMIHPGDWTTALRAFEQEAWRRPAHELRAGYDLRFGKGATYKTPENLEVDAHLRFAIGRFGVRSQTEQLFDAADTVVLAGRQIPTLDQVGRLLHACYHAALGGSRHLRAHRDVAQLLLVTEADWAAAVRLAEVWSARSVVARAITETWERLELDVGHPAWQWASEQDISRKDERALAVFALERPFREQALTTISALPLRDVPAYLRAVVSRGSSRRLMSSWREMAGLWTHGKGPRHNQQLR